MSRAVAVQLVQPYLFSCQSAWFPMRCASLALLPHIPCLPSRIQRVLLCHAVTSIIDASPAYHARNRLHIPQRYWFIWYKGPRTNVLIPLGEVISTNVLMVWLCSNAYMRSCAIAELRICATEDMRTYAYAELYITFERPPAWEVDIKRWGYGHTCFLYDLTFYEKVENYFFINLILEIPYYA